MIWLILFAAVSALCGGFYFRGHSNGVDEGHADDRPIIAQLEADKATAVAANKTLLADMTGIRQACAVTSEKVSELGKLGDGIKAENARTLAAATARSQALSADIAKRAAEAATALKTPDQQCTAARSTLGDLSDRMHESEPVVTAPLVTAPAVTPAPATKPSLIKRLLPSAIRTPK